MCRARSAQRTNVGISLLATPVERLVGVERDVPVVRLVVLLREADFRERQGAERLRLVEGIVVGVFGNVLYPPAQVLLAAWTVGVVPRPPRDVVRAMSGRLRGS